jgi:hypothetical protein
MTKKIYATWLDDHRSDCPWLDPNYFVPITTEQYKSFITSLPPRGDWGLRHRKMALRKFIKHPRSDALTPYIWTHQPVHLHLYTSTSTHPRRINLETLMKLPKFSHQNTFEHFYPSSGDGSIAFSSTQRPAHWWASLVRYQWVESSC